MVVLGSIVSNSVQSKHIYYKWLLIADTKVMDVLPAPATAWVLFQGPCDRTKEEVGVGIILAREREMEKHLNYL